MISEKKGEVYYFKVGSYEKIHKSLSKHFKQNMRTARNRLARENKVEFLAVRAKEDLKNWAFQEFIDLEGGGWKGEQGTAIKSNCKIKNSFENMVLNFSDDSKCEISLLKVNGEYIAGLLCFLTDDAVYLAKVGYDERYSYLSPVVILFDELIRRCSNDEHVREIHLYSDARWIAKWEPFSMDFFNIIIFNKSAIGLLHYLLIKSELLLRRYKKSITQMIKNIRDILRKQSVSIKLDRSNS
jgi:hypothetical protein